MKPDRFYANEMQFSLHGIKNSRRSEALQMNAECIFAANEKLLIKMTTQLKLSAGNNSML